MPVFEYRAKKTDGQTIFGQVDARSKEEAVEMISQRGILPIAVEPCAAFRKQQAQTRYKRISFNEIYIFTRQLSNLLKSGVPVLRAMSIIQEQMTNFRFQQIIDSIQKGIKDGKSFSECLQAQPEIFSSLYVSMIQAGEEGGELQRSLSSLAAYQKDQREIFSKVKTALVYPLFMVLTGVMTVVFILLFVLPKITGLFFQMGQELPLLTRILIFSSEAIRQGWFIALPALALFILSIIRWHQSPKGKATVDRIMLKIPFIQELVKKVEFARFARTLELLLNSGVSLVRALDIAVATIENEWVRKDLFQCRTALEAGQSLGQSFTKCKFIPPMIMQMIFVGEESGFLGDTLIDIADAYEQEINDVLKTFTTILEPAMILIVGIVVGFVIIAMLLPIFSMDVLVQ